MRPNPDLAISSSLEKKIISPAIKIKAMTIIKAIICFLGFDIIPKSSCQF